MHPEPVDDFEDPRLADYRNLKDATLATARGRFIVEGRGTLKVLLNRSRYRPDSILLSERTFGSIETDLARLDPRCPVFVGKQSVLDRIVGFPIHRGCLASCTRGQLADPIDLARRALEREPSPRLIVLDGLTNLDNVGLIFRNAMALGAHAVLLCARTCDPLYRKAIRTSMGGSLCVPFARARDLPKMLSELRALGYSVLAFDPDETAIDIRSVDVRRLGPTALLFGTEGTGLRESVLAAADDRVRIAMEPGVDSLNVAVTAGIALSLLRADVDVGGVAEDGGDANSSTREAD
jgi:tRNA G18 (ribose-2'-O)-methylase SpoU